LYPGKPARISEITGIVARIGFSFQQSVRKSGKSRLIKKEFGLVTKKEDIVRKGEIYGNKETQGSSGY
jgi:hypothetical protein